MQNIEQIKLVIFEQIKREDFKKAAISDPFQKTSLYKKITLEIKTKAQRNLYQFTFYTPTQVIHENYEHLDYLFKRLEYFINEGYKQWDMGMSKILMNKKGNWKIIQKEVQESKEPVQNHNRMKNHIFTEGHPVDWLIALGVMNKEGWVVKEKYKKFRQINRFTEMVADVCHMLPQEPVIIDFGCGKSYLTFALYDYLNRCGKRPVIYGLDLKKDVVENCNQLARQLSFERLQFEVGDIQDYNAVKPVDMVVSLHACDTATDYALYNAIKWKAEVIFAVPCCQHELLEQIENEVMKPVLKYGVLKEKFVALLTDGLRAELLESAGYKCQVMEFVDLEHTPKNIMIRAVRNKSGKKLKKTAMDPYEALSETYHVKPKLYELLYGAEND